MKISACLGITLCLFAVPALAQDQEELDYLSRMDADAKTHVTEAESATRAGDTARACTALREASISVGAGYITASGMADDMQDEGASSSDIADIRSIESGFLLQRSMIAEMAADCPHEG